MMPEAVAIVMAPSKIPSSGIFAISSKGLEVLSVILLKIFDIFDIVDIVDIFDIFQYLIFFELI